MGVRVKFRCTNVRSNDSGSGVVFTAELVPVGDLSGKLTLSGFAERPELEAGCEYDVAVTASAEPTVAEVSEVPEAPSESDSDDDSGVAGEGDGAGD